MCDRQIPVGIAHYALAALLAAIVAGCASFGEHSLIPGQSTAQDVEARMGPATEKIEHADRAQTWFYSRQPMGRQTIAVRLGADGILGRVEPVLTYDNLAKVKPNFMKADDLRSLLGPPYRIDRMERLGRNAWGYWMVLDTVPTTVWIQLSDDGVVREIIKIEDLPRITITRFKRPH